MDSYINTFTVNSILPKKDKTVKITIETTLEQSKEELFKMWDLLDQKTVVLFKLNGELTQKELEEIEKAQIEPDGKSKREILRNSLFGAWSRAKEEGKTQKEFEEFYKDYYNKEIEKAKNLFR